MAETIKKPEAIGEIYDIQDDDEETGEIEQKEWNGEVEDAEDIAQW